MDHVKFKVSDYLGTKGENTAGTEVRGEGRNQIRELLTYRYY